MFADIASLMIGWHIHNCSKLERGYLMPLISQWTLMFIIFQCQKYCFYSIESLINVKIHLQSSIPSPPFPHSLLKRRMPDVINANSVICLSLSFLIKDINVPNSVCGNTLCRAAMRSNVVYQFA